MGLSLGGSKNKTKQNTTQDQSYSQMQSTTLSPRAYDLIKDRAAQIGGQPYQALDPNAYQAYMSPFQGEVIDAATADINASRDKALNQQRSDFAAAGAFGDDRRGVEQAALQGEYDRTLATTLAGLRQSGYGQALGVAQSENANRNQYDADIQARIDQLLSLLANETITTGSGTSKGVTSSKGSSRGFNLGFGYGS